MKVRTCAWQRARGTRPVDAGRAAARCTDTESSDGATWYPRKRDTSGIAPVGSDKNPQAGGRPSTLCRDDVGSTSLALGRPLVGLHTTPLFRGRQGRATDMTPY